MTGHRSNERIFELIISDALADLWDKELEEIYNDGSIEHHSFSKEFERNIHKVRRSIGRKERMKNAGRFSLKFFVTIATIMGIAFGGLLTQPTVFASVQNVFRNIFSGYDKYTYLEEQQEDFTFDQNKRLGYIPDGYELRMVFYSANNMYLTYESVDDDTMKFDYGVAENSSKIIDNERHNYYELNNDGVTYYFYEAIDPEADSNILLWYLDDYVFSINAQLDKDELVKVAENIKG